MTPEPDIERERNMAWMGAQLIALGGLGIEHGRALRRLALSWVRIKRRAYWRTLVAERIELGYRDIGGEG